MTSVTASPSTAAENVGEAITLTLNMSEAAIVTGTPTLSLNDGGTATYVSGSGSRALVFSYTVAAGQNTSALAITSANLPNGATITDASGDPAYLSGAVTSFANLQIETTGPDNQFDCGITIER